MLDPEAKALATGAGHRLQQLVRNEVDPGGRLPANLETGRPDLLADLVDAPAVQGEDVVVEHDLAGAVPLLQKRHLSDDVVRAAVHRLLVHRLLEAEAALERAAPARDHGGERARRHDRVVAVHRQALTLRPADVLQVDHRCGAPVEGPGDQTAYAVRVLALLQRLGEIDHDGDALADAHVVDRVVVQVLRRVYLGVRTAEDDLRAGALRRGRRFERAGQAGGRGADPDQVRLIVGEKLAQPLAVQAERRRVHLDDVVEARALQRGVDIAETEVRQHPGPTLDLTDLPGVETEVMVADERDAQLALAPAGRTVALRSGGDRARSGAARRTGCLGIVQDHELFGHADPIRGGWAHDVATAGPSRAGREPLASPGSPARRRRSRNPRRPADRRPPARASERRR